MQASIAMQKGPLNHQFTTQNTLTENTRVDMRLVDGPFRTLEGFWHFEAQDGGTMVTFHLEFEFLNRMMSLLVGPIFQSIVASIVEAFHQRARQLYG